ncbi:MAG: hypothetical protein JNM93_04730 [Bacteriovoracaceae bacterium]|nr:hypothetical protein [Bacteriovoracaceae bacterium]
MKKLLVLVFVLSSMSAMAFERVKPRSAEQQGISDLIMKINNNGGCGSAGKTQFEEWKDIGGNCGGQWTKKKGKDGAAFIKIRNSQCTNVILGLKNLRVRNDSGTRLYKASQYEDATYQVSKDAMGYDGDSEAVISSNSGASCRIIYANF